MIYESLEEAYADVLEGLRNLGLQASVASTGGDVYRICVELPPSCHLEMSDFELLPDRSSHEYWVVQHYDKTADSSEGVVVYQQAGDDVLALLKFMADFCAWNGYGTPRQKAEHPVKDTERAGPLGYITMGSPRAVREILKALARAAADRKHLSPQTSATSVEDHAPPVQTTREAKAIGEAQDQAKAKTAEHLLTLAIMHGGIDEHGTMWVSWNNAQKQARALIRCADAGMEMDRCFTPQGRDQASECSAPSPTV